VPIAVEGLADAQRYLRKIDVEAAKNLNKELKSAAKIVQAEAKSIAAAKGLAAPGRSGRGTGALVSGLRVFSSGGAAGVRDAVNRGGFPYPAVYEYGHGAARAFLQPAGEAKMPEVEAKLRSFEWLGVA
jgi:hypothetical protein